MSKFVFSFLAWYLSLQAENFMEERSPLPCSVRTPLIPFAFRIYLKRRGLSIGNVSKASLTTQLSLYTPQIVDYVTSTRQSVQD
jgi:hypothetical protein